jgi:hypothetical protein
MRTRSLSIAGKTCQIWSGSSAVNSSLYNLLVGMWLGSILFTCGFNQPTMACKPLNISAYHLAGVVYDVRRFLGVCFPKPDFSLSVLLLAWKGEGSWKQGVYIIRWDIWEVFVFQWWVEPMFKIPSYRFDSHQAQPIFFHPISQFTLFFCFSQSFQSD